MKYDTIDGLDKKISKLNLYPKEKELPRFNYYKLVNYKDPLTSFLDILINKNPSKTIDGRRAYILSPDLDNFNTAVSIKKYCSVTVRRTFGEMVCFALILFV